MATFAGNLPYSGVSGNKEYLQTVFPGRVAAAYTGVKPKRDPTATATEPLALNTPVLSAQFLDTASQPVHTPVVFPATRASDATTPSIDWFEKVHVIAREYDFGNIITTQSAPLEVYNAFRRATVVWLTFANNAGAGVNLLSIPSLPFNLAPQSSRVMTLEVTTDGPAVVNSTLDFTFSSGSLIQVPIQLQRVVLFPIPPLEGFSELLEFETRVFEHTSGTEQRRSIRNNPRQYFSYTYLADAGPEMQRIDAALFDWQARLFGVGVWPEHTYSTTSYSIGATTLNVRSTAFADYRVGGLVLVYESQTKFDVLEIASFTGTQILTTSGTVNAYSAGVQVMPLRLGGAEEVVRGDRRPVNLGRRRIRFEIFDNDVGSLASAAAFPTFNGKVLLSDDNGMFGTMPEAWIRRMNRVDNTTGVVTIDSPWTRDRRTSQKVFYAKGRQAIWELRQLLHFLKGRLTSFYLPTFYPELTPFANLASGSSALAVTNVGYARFIRQRTPRQVIRVVFQPSVGQAPLIRTVVTSANIDANQDSLTLDSTWPATFTPAQVLRIEFLEKSRFDSDQITLDHQEGSRVVIATIPVKTVLE